MAFRARASIVLSTAGLAVAMISSAAAGRPVDVNRRGQSLNIAQWSALGTSIGLTAIGATFILWDLLAYEEPAVAPVVTGNSLGLMGRW